MTQLDVYTEEKFEDEEDMRERMQNLMKREQGHQRQSSESEVVLQDLLALAKQHGDLYPLMVEILKGYAIVLAREIDLSVSPSAPFAYFTDIDLYCTARRSQTFLPFLTSLWNRLLLSMICAWLLYPFISIR